MNSPTNSMNNSTDCDPQVLGPLVSAMRARVARVVAA
jgi:hypothetical protein